MRFFYIYILLKITSIPACYIRRGNTEKISISINISDFMISANLIFSMRNYKHKIVFEKINLPTT